MLIETSAFVCSAALVPLIFISGEFGPETTTADHPVVLLVSLLAIASLAWLAFYGRLSSAKSNHTSERRNWGICLLLIIIGLLIRLLFFDTVSIYEDDWRRYLWDGAQIANGLNPFIFSPSQIVEAAQPGVASHPDLASRAVLAREAGDLVSHINNGDLTTIYPLTAQAAFALAYWIDPFELDGLRSAFLVSDFLALLFIIRALTGTGRSPLWSMVYWLNPILIFVTYSGGHMDVLVIAPIMAAFYCAVPRPLLAGFCLALAVGVKLWPLLLAPILFRHLRRRFFSLASVTIWVTGLSLLLVWPLISNLSFGSGLQAYSTGWINSSFLFPLFREGLSRLASDPDQVARLIIAGFLISLSLYFGLIAKDDRRTVARHCLLMIAALIWLSPTGYPWYLIWLLPFLPFAARVWVASVFLGSAAYYSRFWLGENDLYDIYTRGLVPLWYGLPLFLLLLKVSHVRFQK